ncbi:GerAB/ArcD/ProY family transporter [Alicyclobacillus fastidiosus]|uniref:GerAB/ArcD/ProY family transporter n=1 Tax=Alicyclobacillus fastidiosus TaxID=392011 RepID=A0ABV5AJF6_9BACL|nr:GerAB/ArcD/ProY family transporter [Alicyclobacillus fastidiosus]WEH08337.1 GerAB/ArcD/ProY family transporter [Alicyclobacillus fastidiosus]
MYKLSMFQVVTVTCTSFLPLLFWIFPRYAANSAGVDGQWALLGTCLIALFSAWVHGLLNTRFHKWSGADMPKLVYGNFIGKTVTMLFVPGYLLFIAVSLYSFSITLKALLPNTPRLATIASLTLVSIMGAMYGIEAISRVASIIFPVTILVLGASFIFVLFRGSWTGVFLHPVSISRSISVASQLLPMFFGLNQYIMLSPYYDHRNRNAVWLPIFCVGFSSALILSVYVITIRVVGYEGLRVLAHPIDFVLQLVQLHGLIIQRFGVVLVFISTMFEAVFFANHLWALSEASRRLLQLKKTSERWFIFTYAVITVIMFQVIPNQQIGDWIVLHILVPLSWFYLVIEPSMKLFLSYVRSNRLKSGAN